ncbi:MAG: hypothetical protein GX308_06025 [Epulopiscium sp.]|nr:hypothetical protein [Candidatus Epulonipiscium sp.]
MYFNQPPFWGQLPFPGQPGTPGSSPYGQPLDFPPQSNPSGPPAGAPPSFVPQQMPQKSIELYKIDPGAIRPCTHQFVYIWLNNGQSFWAWLAFVGRNSVAGWRWSGFRWVYFGTDLDNITSFQCY